MDIYEKRALMVQMALLVCVWPDVRNVQAAAENFPPQVSIIWPRQGEVFSDEMFKIKADAKDSDGFVAEVQFFADTNLIGVATNPPFNMLWQIPPPCDYRKVNLKAVATDNLGAKTESTAVRLSQVCGSPPFTFLEIVSPNDGAIFAAPATFVFSAELLASQGEAGPVEFLVGTSSEGQVDQGGALTATTPPASITVSNITEGEYKLSVRYRYNICTCDWMTKTIRVVKLGLHSPRVTASGQLQFDVLTSFPGRQTIIQTSFDLLDWAAISTNQPPTNSFTFTESSPATNSHRFYRVVVPAE